MVTTESFEVEVPGGVIGGTICGTGPLVLVLHGGPGLSDYLHSLSEELESGYTVVRYQQRGLAPSTTSGPFTVERHLSDALAVLEAIAPDGAVVLGHSWGGFLAMHLATLGPEQMVGLVLVDPLGVVGDGGIADMSRILHERLTPDEAARLTELDEREASEGSTADDALESLALTWRARFSDPPHAPAMPPLAISLECNTETWTSLLEHLENQTAARQLHQVRVPTTFVLGAQSPIPPEHGLACAALIAGARSEVLDGCGHFPWIERPGVVRSAVDSLHVA